MRPGKGNGHGDREGDKEVGGQNQGDTRGLKMKFYEKTCPNVDVEKIVETITWKNASGNPSLGAKLLRMHLHDCFVTFQKRMWEVPLGRRDGRSSLASEAFKNLPSPSSNFQILRKDFDDKGLDIRDLVALSGAHTLGITQCGMISTRLFNFTGKGDTDPSIEKSYAEALRSKCRQRDGTVLEMDPGSSKFFDGNYYKIVNQKKGIFESDATLLTNNFASSLVKEFEDNNKFFAAFTTSMVKMEAQVYLLGKMKERLGESADSLIK
ncbi:hypothetical protein C5167_005470 [Papaver somniferum]|uniref:Plant heme peroxidase family profile domain-containing protein n=1 Tax=Papaver somniferum TaxID=3469 RepID=A0A4Y7JEH9_PAPSO|nr:hypothetical protein C5167_005470 [Papaver somniferum]